MYYLIILEIHFFKRCFNAAMDAAFKIIQIYEANYPELLYRVFVINGMLQVLVRLRKLQKFTLQIDSFSAPKVFSLAFSMIKPLLQERTRNKIRIFSHESVTKIVSLFPSIHLTVHQSIVCFSPKQWKAAMLEAIDPEELPVCYGGNLKDPDGNPNCATLASYLSDSLYIVSFA